jgi:hypothetical protein
VSIPLTRNSRSGKADTTIAGDIMKSGASTTTQPRFALKSRRYAVSITSEHFRMDLNRRRSQRILISAPIRVSGTNAAGAIFVENTSTVVVNSHGALILLKEKVWIGQALTMRRVASEEEIECVVKGMNPEPDGLPEIAIEFQKPNPKFWHISFPPSDWNSHSPEAKGFVKPQSVLVPAASIPAKK